MNPVEQITHVTPTSDGAVHLMLTAGAAESAPPEPEVMMQEIWSRATEVGSVLEGILQAPHGEERWGLNE